ncbi:Variant surface glycoprotein [Trypanosoma congolense IL3000]|uniref:Variant surface glycoprotein n=1 Tax=Trypanosoma congolense (strain IL3000) TaxID=1068625 RepID=F9WDI9_TRYCI|nr:Variant surface glycoprotein [Trypanosoma congolense IL3000]
MMMVKIWMVMVFVGVTKSAVGKNHNEAAHNALCDFLKVAVDKWGDQGQGLSERMKKALGRTLFGNESGGDIAELRNNLPSFYDTVIRDGASRGTACGGPESGHSAPHGLICLCTAGENVWPINGRDTLCGKGKDYLGGGSKGWSDKDRNTGQKELNATWRNVVSPCLEGDIGKDLKKSLETFKEQLVNKSDVFVPGTYQLGEGEPVRYSACTGYSPLGVCVMYYNSTTIKQDRMPWWVDLEEAIPEEEKFQEEKKKREEEERRKQQEREKQELPQTAALTSSLPTNNQTDQQHKELNLTTHFQRLNMTSGTPIILPSSWLFRVALLI